MDGPETTRLLHENDSPVKVLALTTFDTDRYVHAALRAGAAGFLLKTAPPVRPVDAVLAPRITRRLIEEFTSRPLPGDASSARGAHGA